MVEDLKSKVELLKKEVEKAKQDIQDMYYKFEKHKFVNRKSTHKSSLKYAGFYIYRPKKEFIIFLREKGFDKNYIDQLKNIKLVKKRKYCKDNYYDKIYYKKEVIAQFKEALSIMDKYGDEYEKDLLEKEFCKLTDCYEKLKTTITCKRCESEIPKEGNFCPQCGYNTVVNIRKDPIVKDNNYIWDSRFKPWNAFITPIITKTEEQKLVDASITNFNKNKDMIFGKTEPLSYYDLTDTPKPKEEVHLCPRRSNCTNFKEADVYCNGKVLRTTTYCFKEKKEEGKLCPNSDNCFSFNHNDRWCLGLTDPPNYRNYTCFKPHIQPQPEATKCPHIINCVHEHSSSICNNYTSCNYYYKEYESKQKCPHYEKCTDPVKKSETSCCHDIKFMYAIETCESYQKFEKSTKCSYYEKCPSLYKDLSKEKICHNINISEREESCGEYQKFEKEAKTPKTCDNCNQDKCNSGSCIDRSRWTPKQEKVLCDSCDNQPKNLPKCKGMDNIISCCDFTPKDGWLCYANYKCRYYTQLSEKCHDIHQLIKCDYYDKGGKQK